MRKSAAIFAAISAMVWMSGCADKDPMSSQNEGTDSAAAKLVTTKNKVAGRCELPPCNRSPYWGNGTITPSPSPGSGGSTPPPKTLTATLPGGAQMEMVWIEPGTFMMGSPDAELGRDSQDEVQHQVTISKGFYLGKYEITQGQWQAVLGTEPWSGLPNVQVNPNNPAVDISWAPDLQAFIHQLNVAAGDSLYRLPTEAEWEYACRAGTTTRWSFGDDESQLKDYAWYANNAWNVGERYAHAVGTKKPNPWGLYDMHGNVWEFVQDGTPLGEGSASTATRYWRGGGVFHDAPFTRSAIRGYDQSYSVRSWLGARLLRVK